MDLGACCDILVPGWSLKPLLVHLGWDLGGWLARGLGGAGRAQDGGVPTMVPTMVSTAVPTMVPTMVSTRIFTAQVRRFAPQN